MLLDVDLKIEGIYTETGTTERPGGQHVGMPATEIRVTHIPTGLIAQCGWHRTQHKNKAVAISMIEWGIGEIK